MDSVFRLIGQSRKGWLGFDKPREAKHFCMGRARKKGFFTATLWFLGKNLSQVNHVFSPRPEGCRGWDQSVAIGRGGGGRREGLDARPWGWNASTPVHLLRRKREDGHSFRSCETRRNSGAESAPWKAIRASGREWQGWVIRERTQERDCLNGWSQTDNHHLSSVICHLSSVICNDNVICQ